MLPVLGPVSELTAVNWSVVAPAVAVLLATPFAGLPLTLTVPRVLWLVASADRSRALPVPWPVKLIGVVGAISVVLPVLAPVKVETPLKESVSAPKRSVPFGTSIVGEASGEESSRLPAPVEVNVGRRRCRERTWCCPH